MVTRLFASILFVLFFCLHQSYAKYVKKPQGIVTLSVLLYDSSSARYVSHPLLPTERFWYYNGLVIELVEVVSLKRVNLAPSKEVSITPVLLDFSSRRYCAFDTLSRNARITSQGEIKNKRNGFALDLDATISNEDLTKYEDYIENGIAKRKYFVQSRKGNKLISSVFWLSKSGLSTPFVLSSILERDGYVLTKIETNQGGASDRFLMEIKVEPQELSKDQISLFAYLSKVCGLKM